MQLQYTFLRDFRPSLILLLLIFLYIFNLFSKITFQRRPFQSSDLFILFYNFLTLKYLLQFWISISQSLPSFLISFSKLLLSSFPSLCLSSYLRFTSSQYIFIQNVSFSYSFHIFPFQYILFRLSTHYQSSPSFHLLLRNPPLLHPITSVYHPLLQLRTPPRPLPCNAVTVSRCLRWATAACRVSQWSPVPRCATRAPSA